MNEITGLQHPLMQALGLAILHSLWQGILLYCLFKLVYAFVPERRSVARYRLGYATLSILFLLFLYTFRVESQLAFAMMRAPRQAPVAVLLIHSGTNPGSFWQLLFSPLQLTVLSRIIPWLSLVYATGVVVLCIKMIRELLQLHYLRKGVILPDNPLLDRFLELKEQAGIGRKVLLRLSERVPVPLMLGHLKPIILLPLSLASRLDTQQIEAILLHELAHIRRNDYLWNLLQTIMETLLFFNPVAWMLSSVIREEREHCCDDYVMRRSKTALPYAHALLALEEYRLNGYAMAATGPKKSLLLNRIKRITTMKPNQKNSQRTLATLTILILFAAMICFVSAFGQDKKEEKTGKPMSKTFSKSYSKSTVTVIDDKGNVKTYNKETGDTAGMAEALKNLPDALGIAEDALDHVDMKDVHKTVQDALAQARISMEQNRGQWNDMRATMEKEMKQVNWDDIQAKVDQALSKVDWDKINADTRKAIQAVDWNEIRANTGRAMAEARRSMKEVDWDQVKKEMAEAREEVDKAMQEAQTRMQLNGADMEEVRRALQDAKEDLKRAKQEMKRAMKEKQDTENSLR